MGKKSASQAQQTEERKFNVKLYLQTQNITKLNIFLMTLIAVVFLAADLIPSSVAVPNPKQLLKQQIQKSRRNLQQLEKDCPTVLEDHESCIAKLKECHNTDEEFKKANSEMTGAITECETVNAENTKLNEKINAEIQKMDEALKKLE